METPICHVCFAFQVLELFEHSIEKRLCTEVPKLHKDVGYLTNGADSERLMIEVELL